MRMRVVGRTLSILGRPLGAMARFAGQVYTSDRAYEAGVQIAATLVALWCLLQVVQHWTPATPLATASPEDECAFRGPVCW